MDNKTSTMAAALEAVNIKTQIAWVLYTHNPNLLVCHFLRVANFHPIKCLKCNWTSIANIDYKCLV